MADQNQELEITYYFELLSYLLEKRNFVYSSLKKLMTLSSNKRDYIASGWDRIIKDIIIEFYESGLSK